MKLVEIWKHVLGIRQVGTADSFFDLGGHSISVFELIQSVQREFNLELRISDVVRFPTIVSLAARIIQKHQVDDENRILIRIRDCGQKTPFFCVPAATSSVYSLRAIATEFKSHQSLLGLEPLGLDGDCEPQDSISDMAETYATAIRDEQPYGPYYLGGRCFGGLVAIEVSRLLQAEGEEIGLVVLLDTAVPNRYLSHLLRHCGFANGLKLLVKYPFERILAKRTGQRIANMLETQLTKLTDSQARRLRAVDNAHRIALRSFKLEPITVPVLWLRAKAEFQTLRFDWTPFARAAFECATIEGDHIEIFEQPNIKMLSSRLSQFLADVQND